MKKLIIALGIVLGLGLAAAGGFWGGMQYQRQQAENITANFFANRPQGQAGQNGQFPEGDFNFPPGGQPGGGIQGFTPGGTVGVIKSIDGNIITLSTAQEVATVTLSDNSQINKTVTVPATELQPGMRIRVMGQTGSDGKIEANTITILNEEPAQNP